MAKKQRRLVHPELFSDVDDLIRELGKLHKIVGTRMVVDHEKVRQLKNTRSRSPVQRRKTAARRVSA
jgi:hypothetical protein